MKKTLKITGIVLASLIGVVLVAVGIALAVVTSSGRLTSMVRKYAPNFVNCEVQLGKADLTIVKTLPNIGVEIDHVALINPMQGSPSDTLANIDKLLVSIDLKQFLKHDAIVVKKCVLEGAFVNLYTDADGHSNLDIFDASSSPDDTTSSSFDYMVDIEAVRIKDSKVLYTDVRSSMLAAVDGLNLDLKGRLNEEDIKAELGLTTQQLALQMPSLSTDVKNLDVSFKGHLCNYEQLGGTLKLATPDISLNLGGDYLQHDTVRLVLPVDFDLNTMAGSLHEAQIALNDYVIRVDGSGDMGTNGDIHTNLELNTNTLVIEDLMTYLPQDVQASLDGIGFSGKVAITDAKVVGTFNDSLMPLITATVVTDKATVDVASLPFPIADIDLHALLDLDLNAQSNLTLNNLTAKFNQTELSASGKVNDVTNSLGLDLDVKADLPMSDLKGFLPDDVRIVGHSDVDMNLNFTLDQLMAALDDFNLNRLNARGVVKIKDFAFDMDTIHAEASKLDVNVVLPASRQIKGRKGVYLALASGQLKARMGNDMNADLKDFALGLTADDFAGDLAQMNLNADLKTSHLNFVLDTLNIDVQAPTITVMTMPVQQKEAGLNARLGFKSQHLQGTMGQAYAIKTESLDITASARENTAKEDILNHWNPEADFSLKNAEIHMDGLAETIYVPNIDFLFNSHELGFKKSTIKIGESDLSLEGNVVGIKEWVEDHNNLMKGEMELTSDFLNINELMDLTSGLGSDPDTLAREETVNADDNPFIVPVGVDFNFAVKTKKAIFDNFDLNNLGGQMTVKDGTLVLQEIGFTNKAAEMQLTAMYQTPRKNHLFLGMDFHLLDVQINDLLTMIPFIDTLVPMLKTFDGQAEFHIAAETNLKSNYQPKISTLRAAADIEGQNLTVNDQLSFTKITDMLKVSTNGEFRIDSLDVQLTVFKDQIELYPFLISIGKYKAVASGRQKLDETCNYHISVTDTPLPTRLGLDVTGNLGDLKFTLAKCKYKNLYRPERRSDTDNMVLELKRKIAESLKQNVL